jgi:transcriptional regulator with XRE-family HTH domain
MQSISLPAQRALTELGLDLKHARLRRHIKAEILAARVSISRTTLSKLEHGDGGISLATFAGVLHSLGLLDRLSKFLDAEHELVLAEERMPKRIR